MARVQGFQRWLTATTVTSPAGDYRHRLPAENALEWAAIQPYIKRYFRKAHADAVRHLRKMAGVSLHPLKKRDPAVDPTRHYPHDLDPTTLKGYFGEVLAYAVVECLGAAGYTDWDVPAYLFRFHTVAFQSLEASRLSGEAPDQVPALRQAGAALENDLGGEARGDLTGKLVVMDHRIQDAEIHLPRNRSSGDTFVVVDTSSRTTPLLNTCRMPNTPVVMLERVRSAMTGNSLIQ